MDAPFLDTLNPQQRAAATAPLESPLLIIAGAGTGKTNTLAHRVAHLIHTGVNPARILLLTFTRRAALKPSLSPIHHSQFRIQHYPASGPAPSTPSATASSASTPTPSA